MKLDDIQDIRQRRLFQKALEKSGVTNFDEAVNPIPFAKVEICSPVIEADLNPVEREWVKMLKARSSVRAIQSGNGTLPVALVRTIALKLGRGSFYTPDVLVVAADGSVECFTFHDTKGSFVREIPDDLKTAARLHRWARFKLVRKLRKSWVEQNVGV